MPTVRFSKLVEQSGQPEPHLVFANPDTDHPLQRAIRENRVVTVFQTMVGHATDHAEVGFREGPARQYLIFPKSVRRFAGRRIIGIKYGLVASGLVEAPPHKRAPASAKPRRAKANITGPAEFSEEPTAPPPSPAATAKKKRPSHPTATVRQTKRKSAPQPKSSTPTKKSSPRPSRKNSARLKKKDSPQSLPALKAKVRQAMRKLEAGHQVAAFRLLQQIVGAKQTKSRSHASHTKAPDPL